MTGTSTGPAPSRIARLLLLLVRGYQRWISPGLAPHCRFAPSCSSYALQAVQDHGALRGGWLSARRLARCHPFHPGGHDPVSAARSTSGTLPGTLPGTVPPTCHRRPVSRSGAPSC